MSGQVEEQLAEVHRGSNTMPYNYGALVIRLRATEDTVSALQRKGGRISNFMGSAVHQALHSSISTITADVLHNPKISAQPFATSTLFRWQLDMPLQGCIAVGERAWIRFVALHPYIVRELEAFRRSNERKIEIDRTPWKVSQCMWGGHLYAGFCSSAQRMQEHNRLPPPRLIRLRFLSPTYFKSKDEEYYLNPEPRLVFAEGLLKRWREYCPQQSPPDGFEDFVNRYVSLRQCIGYATRTIMVKGHVARVFTGDAVYSVDVPARPDVWFEACARFWGLMAEYATYAGVGKKTTMGLGMVDRVRIIRGV